MRMVRTAKWKLVRDYKANGLDELYDLGANPGEEKNLYAAAKHAGTRSELQRKLTKWTKAIDDPLLKGDR
jgi:arylsulfatase A-like enzyme